MNMQQFIQSIYDEDPAVVSVSTPVPVSEDRSDSVQTYRATVWADNGDGSYQRNQIQFVQHLPTQQVGWLNTPVLKFTSNSDRDPLSTKKRAVNDYVKAQQGVKWWRIDGERFDAENNSAIVYVVLATGGTAVEKTWVVFVDAGNIAHAEMN